MTITIKNILISTFFLCLGVIIGASGYLLFCWHTCRPSSYVAVAHQVTGVCGKPFLLGFSSLAQETSIKTLTIKGKIPAWIHGTFLSIGPGQFEINESKASHWLDGFAMVHRFTVQSGSVSYANKLIKTNYYKEAVKKGVITGTTPDPSISTWSKLKGALSSSTTRPMYDNVNINVFALGKQLMALTETPQPICIDCHTLETQNTQRFKDTMGAHFSSGHPLLDPNTNEWINVGIQYALSSTYVVYKMSPDGKQRIALATVKTDRPSYVHSFALTKKYIVITEMPLRVRSYDLLMQTKSFIDTHVWDPKGNSIFIIVDRNTGKVIDTIKTHPFFSLHHVNAFDTPQGLTVDIVTYKNPSILKSLGFDHLYQATEHTFPLSALERFELNLTTHTAQDRVLAKKNIEMPQINYRQFTMSPYTYVYGVSLSSPTHMANEIIKINVKSGSHILWQQAGCYPTEPVFIPAPQAKNEDDGILLCVVLDTANKNSFLLFLDAKNLKELGRAIVPHHIPFTVHSSFMHP